jgi:hypothetical protein
MSLPGGSSNTLANVHVELSTLPTSSTILFLLQ